MGRKRKDIVNDAVLKLLPFVFYTLDVLYEVTRKLPARTKTFDNIPMINASRFFVVGLPEDDYYKDIRLALALVSDLYFLLEGIMKHGDLMEIEPIITKMDTEARKFEDIRNFYTHLDERISDLAKHGVNGKADTNCGIKYDSNAKNCFHLVVGEGEIHFSDEKKPKEVDMSKIAFDPIFTEARNLFVELTNNKLSDGRKEFPPATLIYPI